MNERLFFQCFPINTSIEGFCPSILRNQIFTDLKQKTAQLSEFPRFCNKHNA
jgi:hypothetical protein